MKKLILFFSLVLALLCSCCTAKPVATTSHERIEEHLKPVAIGADTIELEYRLQSTDNRYNPLVLRTLPLRQGENMSAQNSSPVLGEVAKPEGLERLEKQITKIKSTRVLNIESRHTDTTQTLRITLRPDTIYVPYTTHIRSDTIVAPCPVTQAKLTTSRWYIAMLIFIIILIVVVKIRITTRN